MYESMKRIFADAIKASFQNQKETVFMMNYLHEIRKEKKNRVSFDANVFFINRITTKEGLLCFEY